MSLRTLFPKKDKDKPPTIVIKIIDIIISIPGILSLRFKSKLILC